MKTIGHQIRDARLARGLQQHELGELAGLHGLSGAQAGVARWESGAREVPLPALARLAVALGVPLTDVRRVEGAELLIVARPTRSR